MTDSTRPDELTATATNAGVDAAVAAARRVIAALLHAGDGSPAEMASVAEQLDAVAGHLESNAPSREERLVDGVDVTRQQVGGERVGAGDDEGRHVLDVSREPGRVEGADVL